MQQASEPHLGELGKAFREVTETGEAVAAKLNGVIGMDFTKL